MAAEYNEAQTKVGTGDWRGERGEEGGSTVKKKHKTQGHRLWTYTEEVNSSVHKNRQTRISNGHTRTNCEYRTNTYKYGERADTPLENQAMSINNGQAHEHIIENTHMADLRTQRWQG